MKCQEVMTRNPRTCTPEDTVQDAARMMKEENVGPIPVVEARGSANLIGIVTDRDIAIQVVAKGKDASTRVKDVMTRNPITCMVDDDVQKAMEVMESRQVRRLPVVDDGGSLVGIIAQADIATRVAKDRKTGDMVQGISES